MVLRDQIGTQIDSTANLVGRMYEARKKQCMIYLSKMKYLNLVVLQLSVFYESRVMYVP